MKTQKSDLNTLPFIRKRVKPRSVLHRIFAATSANRFHAPPSVSAPAAQYGDVPNMNVGRAIVVVVVLHILGLLGYFLREKIALDKAAEVAAAAALPIENTSTVALNPISNMDDLPAKQAGQRVHTITTEPSNESYASIATLHGVTEQALRDANKNIAIVPGNRLLIPARTAEAIIPAELARLNNRNQDSSPAGGGNAIQPLPPNEAPAPPKVTQIIQPSPTAPRATSKVHTVKKGETFFSIARMHGINIKELQTANPTHNPNRLKIGAGLKVPAAKPK
jgi:LysM repeat protein